MTDEETNDSGEAMFDLPFHLYGKNPDRVRALRDLWYKDLVSEVEEDDKPEDAKRRLIFMMSIAATLDMVMGLVPEKLAETIATNIDDFVTMAMVNARFDVDLLNDAKDAFVKHHGDTFETEEEFRKVYADFEERWWNTPKQGLGGRTPNEALKEEAMRYDLDKEKPLPRSSVGN